MTSATVQPADVAFWMSRCDRLPEAPVTAVAVTASAERLEQLRARLADRGMGCLSCWGSHPSTEMTPTEHATHLDAIRRVDQQQDGAAP